MPHSVLWGLVLFPKGGGGRVCGMAHATPGAHPAAHVRVKRSYEVTIPHAPHACLEGAPWDNGLARQWDSAGRHPLVSLRQSSECFGHLRSGAVGLDKGCESFVVARGGAGDHWV